MKTHLLALLTTTLFLVTCATQKNDVFLDGLADQPSSQLLTSTEWIIISGYSVNENNVKTNLNDLLPNNGSKSIVTFNNSGQLNIRGGCNTLMGSWYLTHDNVLKISLLASTMKACETSLMKLDNAAQSLFSNKAIIVRVPHGLDNSLIKMQTDDNVYYFSMQAANKISKNHQSYAGKYFSDGVFEAYTWKLINAFNQNNNAIITNSLFKTTTFNKSGNTLLVQSTCGDISFPVNLTNNDIYFGNIASVSKGCTNSTIIDSLENQHYTIQGPIIGKKPEIKLINNNGNLITLKGNKKKENTDTKI